MISGNVMGISISNNIQHVVIHGENPSIIHNLQALVPRHQNISVLQSLRRFCLIVIHSEQRCRPVFFPPLTVPKVRFNMFISIQDVSPFSSGSIRISIPQFGAA